MAPLVASLVSGAVSLLAGFFKGDGVSKAAGIGNGLMFYGAAAFGGYWLLSGDAAAWSITLNARELAGVVMVGALGVEWVRRMNPPTV